MESSPRPARPVHEDPRPVRKSLWVVLLASALLLVCTSARMHGYRIGDTLEYMDRAWDVVHGRELAAVTRRSFAISAAMMPYFEIADALGIRDLRGVVIAIRATVAVLSLWTVVVLVRMALRVAGPVAAIAAGLFLGLNPVFQQYGAEPLNATLAMLGVLLGFEALFAPKTSPPGRDPDGVNAGLRAGLGFGIAFLAAYQTIPLTVVLVGLGLARDRLRRRRFYGGIALVYAGCVLAGCTLDALVYEGFGSSLWRYLGSNVGGILSSVLGRLGLREWGFWIYENWVAPGDILEEYVASDAGEIRSRLPPTWYVTAVAQGLMSWPAALFTGLGALVALRRPRWITSAALVAIVFNVALLSMKGTKSYRLVMPFLPLIALFFGLGIARLASWRSLSERWRGPAAWTAAAGSVLLGLPILFSVNLEKHAGFWQGMESVKRIAREENAKVVAGSSLYWGILFRQNADVEIRRLPVQLKRWTSFTPAGRQMIADEIRGYDFFIASLPLVRDKPPIMQVLAEHYRFLELYWDPEHCEDVGPVALFGAPREGLAVEGKRLYEIEPRVFGRRFTEAQAAIEHPTWIRFGDGEDLALVFLGWDAGDLHESGRGLWVAYHWFAQAMDRRKHEVVDELHAQGEYLVWRNRARCYGVRSTQAWVPGSIVTERYFVDLPPPAARLRPYELELRLSARSLLGSGEPGPPLPAARRVGEGDDATFEALEPDEDGRITVGRIALPD